MRVSFLLSVLFFTQLTHLAGSSVVSSAKNQQPKSEKVVAAYFAGWDIYGKNGYTVEHMYPIAHKLTHIIYAFAKPNPDKGTCELLDSWADIGVSLEHHKKLSGNFAKLLELKAKFPHLKILLSIGGGTYSKDISKIVKKGDLKKFAASCVALLDRYEYSFVHSVTGKSHTESFSYKGLFDGLDLDWEWLNSAVPKSEAKAFAEMMSLFRELLDKRSLKLKSQQFLTAALQANASVYNSLRLDVVSKVVDWFNLMAYNFTTVVGRSVGLNAPIRNPWSVHSVENAVQGVVSAGVAPSKIVLGIPLYGHLFGQTSGELGGSFERTSLSGPLSYGKIKERYLGNDGCEYKWHDTAMVPYLYCAQDKLLITFDDESSVKEKVKYSQANRLRGIVFWRLAQDDDQHSLVNAI